MNFSYIPKNVCSQQISFDIHNNKVLNVHFTRGCSGNLQGIGKLVEALENIP